jgi:uncharacterized protein (TIGR01244 family)
MKSRLLIAASAALAILCVAAAPAQAQQVTKDQVPGITNLSRLETTVACSGAITPDAVPKIKDMGFVTIINLRESSEPGANVEEEEATAKKVGLRYYHIPFNASSPDPAAAEKFIEAITTKGSEPAFIHCSGGNRAATMWLIKRLVVDRWDVERATKEAGELGQTNPKLRQWALDYAESHKR